MSYVFDASSILILTSKLQGKVIDIIKESTTTSLAYYEIGNALWKECHITKRLTFDEATEVLTFTFSLLDLMEIIHTSDLDIGVKTLSNANKLGITYYDAAYLTTAQELNKTLVTDDEKLIHAAKETRIKTVPSRNFTP